MTHEERYDLIERYLEEKLIGAELDLFRKKMREDAQFAYDVQVQRLIYEQIKEHRKEELKQFLAREGEVKYIQNIWGTKWLYASAAILLFFTGFYFVIEYVIKPGQPSEESAVGQEEIKQELSDTNRLSKSLTDTYEEQKTRSNASDTIPDLAYGEIDKPITEDILSESGAVWQDEHVLGNETDSVSFYDSEDYVVGDEKLTSKKYSIYPILSSVQENSSKKPSAPKKGDLNEPENEETQRIEKTITETKEQLQLNVEFWKSPVNFKGYSYQKGVLVLFGIDPSETLYFAQNERGMLFMKRNGVWYSFQSNVKDKAFNKVTDSETLKLLPH